jgi:hypothetical protein
VVIGHGPESAGLEVLQPRIRGFFVPSTPDLDRKALLLETGGKYVLWGPSERTLGSWDPSRADFLGEIFRTGDYSLYTVFPVSSK